ncbi:MFS transporter [Staphylococcus equorum subsp. linens]|uniref:MFS transporter n=1 Tax=Staphylococcus equorum TaxID=246432 RepID=UPI000CD04B45|nr:MFS transporter [Staphylococcus equorum]MDK9843404.1 MFS transporter [Staphylococcus equorum]PNZ07975.1 MFS transporter [Staphylococcus equorum subsp. linens]QQT17087.1 MFS transporter [Staphylococcus equorum]
MKSKIWTKDFIIYSSINFLLILVYFLLNSTITTYAQIEYNASSKMMGLIAGIFIVGALIGRLLIGFLKITKKMFIMNILFFTLTIILYFIKLDEAFLIIVRFLNGISIGITTTIVGTIVALVIPEHRKGEGISYFAVSTALATGLGPFIGITLTQNSNFINIFYISFIFGIISLIFSFLINVPENDNRKNLSFRNLLDKRTLPIGFIIFLSAFSFSGIVSYINLYAIEIDLVKTASFFFILYTMSVLFSRPFTGKIVDIHGSNIIMYPAFILFFLGLIMLSMSHHSWIMMFSAILIGLGFGNISSITQTIAVSNANPQNIGLATSTFMIFMDLGNGIGPYALGFIIPLLGYSGMYKVLSIVVIFTVFLYIILNNKKS